MEYFGGTSPLLSVLFRPKYQLTLQALFVKLLRSLLVFLVGGKLLLPSA
jgi:hypothetical protein